MRTKETLHASERDTERVRSALSAFIRRVCYLDARRLVFLDESGVNLAMTRRYGGARRKASARTALRRRTTVRASLLRRRAQAASERR